MESIPLMTEKEHLECEIQELELEIEDHKRAIQNLINVQNRRKLKLEELERHKSITLEHIIVDCMIGYNNTVIVELMERILDRVEVEMLPKKFQSYSSYNEGWNDCIEDIKARIRE